MANGSSLTSSKEYVASMKSATSWRGARSTRWPPAVSTIASANRAERGVGPVPDHDASPGRAADSGDLTAEALPQRLRHRICIPEIARAMTSRWISEVPSKIV